MELENEVKPLELIYDTKYKNREILFSKALTRAKCGHVLYITNEEVTEVPEAFLQESHNNRFYLKLLTFLYVKGLNGLLEHLSTLPDWQNKPSTIILDGLDGFADDNNKMQVSAGIVALLLDCAKSCSLESANCAVIISLNSEKSNFEIKRIVECFVNTHSQIKVPK